MATTVVSDVLDPEILAENVQGAFAGKNAFMGSRLTALGVIIVNGTMPVANANPRAIGTKVSVPYWGNIGDFEENVGDGTPATPRKIQQTVEDATIKRDTLAFEVTTWAQGNGLVNENAGNAYSEATRQIMVAAERAIDKRCIDAAVAPGVYSLDISNSVNSTLTYDVLVDAALDGWGDESQDDYAALLMHSQAHKDLLKLKDGTGNLLMDPNQPYVFFGKPIVVSDRVPVTGSSMGAVTASGSSPPVLTLTGTPKGPFRLVIDCTVGGAHGTAKIRFSTDNGNTWSGEITTHATPGTAQPLRDPNIDSIVGVTGDTGLTFAFAAGTFNADNLWTSNTTLITETLALKRGALAFWYCRAALGLKTDEDILKDSNLAAMHLYGAAHRYKRLGPNSTRPGVIKVRHKVSGFS